MNDLFNNACQKFLDGYWIEAYSLFKEFLDSTSEVDLVDDALLNLGLISILLGNPEKAEMYFLRVIEEFPEAEIDTSFSHNEIGKSSLKAAYHLIEIALAKEDIITANNYFDKYFQDDDLFSGINNNENIISYAQLAKAKISAL